MRLSELIAGLPISGLGNLDPELSGVSHDSRRIEAGDLFVAWQGRSFDGRSFVDDAVARGAGAVLSSSPPAGELSVPVLIAPDPKVLLGRLAARVYDYPDRELLLVGVTGTNGKGTVVQLVASMLTEAGREAASLGSQGFVLGDRSFDGERRTTPQASDLFRLLRLMRAAGAEAAALEVSSHALAEGRISELHVDVAVFTNLSQDHFDYHSSFEDYFAAKRRLFDHLKEGGHTVVNLDDPWGRRLAGELGSSLTYSASGNSAADVSLETVELDRRGMRGTLVTPRGKLDFKTGLLGRFNAENLTAAVAVGEALGLEQPEMVRALGRQLPLPGRLEPVCKGQSFGVYVDYAHTPAALETMLRSLRELGEERIILVFGCGGEKDVDKRPLMGRVAGQLAQLPIITADNPRGEDPTVINGAVEAGVRESGNADYRIVPDRREALRRAIAVAASRDGWAVVVAGKGDEGEQIVGGEVHPFSDRQELELALEELGGPAASR